MARSLTVLLALLAIVPAIFAAEPVRERIEWADIWVTDADKDDLPRVLFIGDSITRGYFGNAEKNLAGKAYCARLATSKCVADPVFTDEVLLLLKHYKFDVIHFNNGLHGWGYTEPQYRDGLAKFVETLKTQAGDAKLIWASTTPMRNSSNLQEFHERNPRVEARNRMAAEIMAKQGVATDDLYQLVAPHPDWYSNDGVHFNDQGRNAQGTAVAESVLQQLGQPAAAGTDNGQ